MPTTLARARAVFLGLAAVLWLIFVLAVGFDAVPVEGGTGLLAAGVWHAIVGFTLARAFPPREYAVGASEGAFAMTRNVLLATVVSLVTALVAVYAVRAYV